MHQAEEVINQVYQPYCIRVEPTKHIPDITEDIRNGLLEYPRTLPPKYFYDDHGSMLFERICETEEYYPTRVEDDLLSKHGDEIIAATRPDQILELGSGSSRKTRRLFDACETQTHICGYSPFDVCEPVLNHAADKLRTEYEWLQITPLVGDYHAGLENLPAGEGVRMCVFLGSSIGNFYPDEAQTFIKEIRNCMRSGDYFLLGADRVKDTKILHAAYNDAEGFTAEFNLNVLRVLNRELKADFNLKHFDHQAIFNTEFNRIEMYLISKIDQTIHLGKLDTDIFINSGEKILTELSYKFLLSELESMIVSSGFDIVQHFEPSNQYYSLILAKLI